MESPLQEFVRLHHLDLTRRINFQINTFREHIHEQELFQQLSSYPLTYEQVTAFSSFFILDNFYSRKNVFYFSNRPSNTYVIFVKNNWKALKK